MGNKVLVVDDEPNICELLSIALTNKGIEVRTASNGMAGIKAFVEFGPDVVLLDHRLPDMCGNDVAKRIKELGTQKKARVIMMSGEETTCDSIDHTLYAGLLKKPFKLSEMVEYVEKYLK